MSLILNLDYRLKKPDKNTNSKGQLRKRLFFRLATIYSLAFILVGCNYDRGQELAEFASLPPNKADGVVLTRFVYFSFGGVQLGNGLV